MAIYRNPNCPYCGNAFTENDDVVVCPECGTAHHRSCWTANGKCACTDLHGKPVDEPPHTVPSSSAESFENCPRCGYRNRPNVSFCSGCGMPFRANANAPYNNPTVGFNPSMFDPSINFSAESDFEDVPAADVARLVDKNTLYYMPIFARIRAGSGGRFNLCALLFGGGWMLFRKQYKRGAIVLGIQALLRVMETVLLYVMYWPLYNNLLNAAGITDPSMANQLTQEQATIIVEEMMKLSGGQLASLMIPMALSIIGVIFSIVIGFKANKWYYRDTLQKARKIRGRYGPDSDMTIMEEERQGGTNMPLGIGLLIGASIVSYIIDFVIPLLLK